MTEDLPPDSAAWVSPYTLPPLPNLQRSRGQSSHLKSPDLPRPYYAAAWGSPYATPSPRRSSRPTSFSGHHAAFGSSSPSLPTRQQPRTAPPHELTERSASLRDQQQPTQTRRNPRAEALNWLSDSEDNSSEASGREGGDQTPTRDAYLDSWGPSPASTPSEISRVHRRSESLATITPDIFHGADSHPIESDSPDHLLFPSLDFSMAAQDSANMNSESKPPQPLDRRMSLIEAGDKPLGSPTSPLRPRPNSMQSHQRPKKKVVWKGKACIIALPLTDREAAGLPPLLTAEQFQDRISGWIAQGYIIDGLEPTNASLNHDIQSSGQSRPLYPDPQDMQSERKLHKYHVHLPNQAEWESWVNHLKEEKLRALGVSPSNSEAPPSTRSPFSPDLSRVSSGYPGLAPSPPVAPSSSASNPLRATSNPFSPSLMSSAGISPQPGSVNSSQFSGLPKPLHAHKQSVAQPTPRGRINSPFDHALSQSISFSPGVPPSMAARSSRQNSFSPNNPLRLPNLSEVLSPISQQPGFDARGPNMNLPPTYTRHGYFPSQANFTVPHPSNWKAPSPALPQRVDSLARTPEFRVPSRSPIEIAHPTPKSHRHNLSMALQREIDEAEASLTEKDRTHNPDSTEDGEEISRKDSHVDESMNDEPPILRRPETLTDERSEIETNPSIAATPMLMDDKNPFVTWQALSDAAKGDTKPSKESSTAPSKFNVQAKEFDPRGGFSSSNFTFNGDAFAPFGLSQPPLASAPVVPKTSARNRSSLSHLNADAPAFTPSFLAQPTPERLSFGQHVEDKADHSVPAEDPSVSQNIPKDSGFKFSSATFNVDAPVFSPSQSLFAHLGPSLKTPPVDKTLESNSIFGNVVIDPDSKVTRRASKALTITRPRSKDGPVEADVGSSGEDIEDDGGRPMAPADRQKRARRIGSGGNRSPIYSDSAPFRQSSTLSEGFDSAKADLGNQKDSGTPFEGWLYISPDENELKPNVEPVDEKKSTSHSPQESESSFTFKNETDAARFNDARPPWDGKGEDESTKVLEQEPVVDGDESNDDLSNGEDPEDHETSPKQPKGQSHKVKSSLSALAKPFHFSPQLSSPKTTASFAAPRKTQGLEASRFAGPMNPQESPAILTANLSSPPPDLDQYREREFESKSEVEVEVKTPSDAEAKALSISTTASMPKQDVENLERKASIHSEPRQEALADEDELMPVFRHDHQDEPEPSFEEIDAVMKQFEVHPELGIERLDTPLQSTPLVDMRLSGNFRSDAPSPSPVRLHDNRILQSEGSYPPSAGLGIGIHKLNTGREDVSDWGGTLPAVEEAKLQLRSQFFDGHVNELVDGILENRLGPLERTLQTMQNSLALIASGSKARHDHKSMSIEVKDSDADDEDDYDAFEGFASYRTKSPMARREVWKQDRIRAAVTQALASYEPPVPAPSALDLTELSEILQEIRQVALQTSSLNTQHELKTVVEDVISQHPRLRGSRVQQDHESTEGKLRPQIDGLESMLKMAKEHTSEEVRLRRQAEEQVAELKLRLRVAEEEAAQYREASEETQQTLVAFLEEKESYKNLEDQLDSVTLQNNALQTTLEEYRVSSDQWRDDIREERSKNKALRETLHNLAKQLEDQSQSRTLFRNKVERLQEDLTRVVQDTQSEQADSREREHKLLSNIALVEDALSQERRHRARAEAELDALHKENRSNLRYKTGLEEAERDISRLNDLVASLREDNRALDTKAFELGRELEHVQKSKDAEVATSSARLSAELEITKTQLQSIRTDADAQISRLQSRLDHAELDLEDQKAKHDSIFSETIEAHKEALRESNERRESSLEDQHQMHEKKLNDLRERHTRELHNSFDNRTRLEHQLNEKLSLGEDKNKHLQSRIADLEDRLDVAKSALRAAAEAALAKGVNLPTPAPSVVASPPQRAASASISFAKGTDLPEKISPQALRESIMVLQDQLQNREMKIEKLEIELAAIDKDAPNKIKERDTEIGWLRELLSVRADDLEDIINTLAQPDFNRETVKDAAIRLRANLQMEQQLKERAHSGLATSLPSISSLTSYAQSPKALPMAAVAALSNWRRARDTSIGAISDFATGIGSQTPSRSTLGSPSSILSGIMTPPTTTQRQSGSSERSAPPPSMRPLAAAAAAQARNGGVEARPLRAYNSQPRALSSRQQEKRSEESHPFPQIRDGSPHTPTQSKRPSLDFADDVDEDASPLDGRHTKHLEEAEPISE
ncbi:uncharacterized protein A1O9_07540 [Exophiala aquamarina CBS 119918]|uniref:Myosin class II heavy chain n=1 Tax=Exophiala aquamarina CBS 119918 TaxID=1182545 RepID=A0A072PKA5_9EURO|nr:uncharacterized protein A1O9_07540 [Exophiala aquamarina CBS 119918]KEF55960.1 hypothetical protein A1O9_07540 [Exophiala aquamarina CBS 119918]